MTTPLRLMSKLRQMMSGGLAPLGEVIGLVAAEIGAEVCSIYAMRPGDMLELRATHGLNPEAVGQTRLRVGQGIVGLVAASGMLLNLADAQNHPAFAYRPETGEDRYASLLALPVRRAGHTLGVLVVQCEAPRRFGADDVEVLETVAMLLAELLAATGAVDGAEEGFGAALPRQFDAVALAPGIAIGPLIVLGTGRPPRHVLSDDAAAEGERLRLAVAEMRAGLDELIASRLPEGREPREVLEATRLIAADEGWLRRVAEAIEGGLTAEAAVHRVASELRERMRRIADPYLRERLADMEDAALRVLVCLEGQDGEVDELVERSPAGAILFARRLGPAQLLDWHARGIAGVVVEEGSASGHAAIMARALGLPALGGVRGAIDAAEAGDEVVLDADDATLILRPEQEVHVAYLRAIADRDNRIAGFLALRGRPSVSADGTPFRLLINAGLTLEVDQLDKTGAAGIGLFRTEIAMMARGSIPDVAEQQAIYGRVMDAADGRPVRFRTLDLGGDKLLPDAPSQPEENPAMGWRSLRVGLDRPAILRRQLRAMLLAANGRPLSVMFPMVATLAEFRQARGLLYAEAARIRPAPASLQIGTMLEVPALLWALPELMREAHFVSIGSNDLLQFLFAADRGAPGMAGRYDLISAPMLSMLDHVVREAAAAGVPLSLCGEAASRPLEAMVLASLGITELSMSASSVLPVKSVLGAVDLAAFRPVLDRLRANTSGHASLREPVLAWAREQGLAV